MGDKSNIEWTDATWNPVAGCSVISPGCANCYAMKMAGRLEAMGQAKYTGLTTKTKAGFVWNGTMRLDAAALEQPLRWKRPRRIFVNSMSDLFHESLPTASIDQVFAVMAMTQQHTYQVLTKRADRMRAYLTVPERPAAIGLATRSVGSGLTEEAAAGWLTRYQADAWPLPNVWLGVSVEDQARADQRIGQLLAAPAAARFLSCEPLLGPIDLTSIAVDSFIRANVTVRHHDHPFGSMLTPDARIDWVIAGGESGPGARPMHPDWARGLRDQCHGAAVPFLFKQWGDWAPDERQQHPRGDYVYRVPEHAARTCADATWMAQLGKHVAGRELDGRTWDEFPT